MSKMPRVTVALLLIVSIFFIADLTMVLCQDCAVSGRWCMDDKACCGGCCRNNACIDMYYSCFVYDDLCLTHPCPGGLECYIYQPNCAGCSPQPDCRRPRQY